MACPSSSSNSRSWGLVPMRHPCANDETAVTTLAAAASSSSSSSSFLNPKQQPNDEASENFQESNNDDDDLLINMQMQNSRLELFGEKEDVANGVNGSSSSRESIPKRSLPNSLGNSHSSGDRFPMSWLPFRKIRTPSCTGTFDRPNGPFYDPYNANDSDVPLLQAEDDSGAHVQQAEDIEHCHVNKSRIRNKTARNQLLISSALCFIFMIAEIVGGYLSNSLAIMTDAAHLLSDLGSFLISLFALWLGSRPPSQRMSFGYYRAEILGALISILVIWLLTGILVYLAIKRIIDQQYDIDADIMLIVASVGVGMNILMGFVLNTLCHCHTHSHGLSHEHSHSSHQHSNINVRAAFIHVVGDLIQSIGVLIAALIVKFKPEYRLADPICTFIFSVLVLITTMNIIRDAVHVLMEGSPKNIDYSNIKNDLQNIEGVKMAHSLHIWSLTMENNALIVHLAIDPNTSNHQILKNALKVIRKKYNIYHSTIQTEPYDPLVMTQCRQCLQL